jgi:alkyl hydroperoxide reductase subunit AhpC
VTTVVSGIRKKLRLSEYRGKKNVVLAFHPLNWTPVCTVQMPGYNAQLQRFSDYDTEVISVSVDSIYSTIAWEKEIGPLDYPLASDYFPHGAVAQKYGVFRDQEPFAGVSERAVFVVDENGKIAFSKIYPMDQLPDTNEIFAVLEELKANRQGA